MIPLKSPYRLYQGQASSGVHMKSPSLIFGLVYTRFSHFSHFLELKMAPLKSPYDKVQVAGYILLTWAFSHISSHFPNSKLAPLNCPYQHYPGQPSSRARASTPSWFFGFVYISSHILYRGSQQLFGVKITPKMNSAPSNYSECKFSAKSDNF